MHALFGIYEEEDPDSSNKIIYNGFYLCWKIWFLTWFVLIWSLMIFRLIKELRNQYVDLFKVMQFASLIFSWFIMTIYYILLFADSYLPTYLRNINQIDEAWIIFFISSNQMWTGTLILHLIKYSSLHEGVNFNDIRVKIRKIEKIHWIYFY